MPVPTLMNMDRFDELSMRRYRSLICEFTHHRRATHLSSIDLSINFTKLLCFNIKEVVLQ
jgi:hypothetical protein